MQKSKLILTSFLCSAGVVLYVFLMPLIINSDAFNNSSEEIAIPFVLLLFVFSALITALLVLGYPIWLYLEQKKKEAVLALGYNVVWLLVILIVVFIVIRVVNAPYLHPIPIPPM